MTLDQVGAKVGFIRSYIYRVESGKVTPGIENFVRFAEAFEVEPHKLLKTICKIRRQLEAPEPVVVAPEVTA
jgi:transcriptional regulator with XRE-family HTH domain